MKTVRLSAVGDILLSGTIAEMIESKCPEEPFIYISNELRKSDFVFGNLECPLSNRGNPLKNKCCLHSPPETVKSLKSAGFDVLSLANNHIFDYGFESFEDTVFLLKRENISYFGAGKNLEEARKPVILHVNGLSIGFVGYSWNDNGIWNKGIKTTKDKYEVPPLDKKIITEDVRNLKEKTDIVIVSLHCGYESERYPLPSQRKLAHKVIDSGASLILGHHPHVLQGIEEYNNGLIVYSLGNFVFPNVSYERFNLIQKKENRESMIFCCEISKDGIRDFEVTPVKSNDYFQPIILKGREKTAIIKKIENLSGGFKLPNYSHFWRVNRVRKDLPDATTSKTFNKVLFKIHRVRRRVLKTIIKRREGVS